MTLQSILDKAKQGPARRLAVVAAEDADVLFAVNEAVKLGIVEPVLIGDEEKIGRINAENGFAFGADCILDEPDHATAARRGVEMAAAGKVDAIMKGQLHSAVLMRAILNKEWGIRVTSVLSHVGLIESPKVGRILYLTDGAMCMYPDLPQKIDIIKNAVTMALRLGVETPRVACLAAVETVNPDMPSTLDAAAAEHKGLKSPVGVVGNADVLLVPNIEAGNILLKASRHIADCSTVGLLAGAKVPIIMSSRADTAKNKLLSIACAVHRSN